MGYVGFKKLVAGGASPALAAYIGRKKYGAKKFDASAAKGQTMENAKPVRVKRKKKAR